MTVASREKIVGWYVARGVIRRATTSSCRPGELPRPRPLGAIGERDEFRGTPSPPSTSRWRRRPWRRRAPCRRALTRGNVTAEADRGLARVLQWRTHAPTVAVAIHDASRSTRSSVADEVSAFARVARTSYELVGAPPTLVAAACVVAASPYARAVAEAASHSTRPGAARRRGSRAPRPSARGARQTRPPPRGRSVRAGGDARRLRDGHARPADAVH